MLKRILTQNLGWHSVEVSDGIEALAALSSKRFDLLLLDLEMPVFNGAEVLEVLRESPTLRDLPVVIVSQERRREIIMPLMEYNVAGYLLKPLRVELVTAKLEGLGLKEAAHYGKRDDTAARYVSRGSPALLIDGNLDYRHFFTAEAGRFGPVRDADSSAAGLALFRENPVDVVFVGTKLGVMRADMLVRKLRDAAGDRRIRVVGVIEGTNGTAPTFARRAEDKLEAGWDDRMVRTFVPSLFALEFGRFVLPTGSVAGVTELLPEFRRATASAVEQVFGMMLGSAVEAIHGPIEMTVALHSTITMDLDDRFRVSVIVQLSEAAVDEINGVLIGPDATSADRVATASELVNLVAGRLHAHAGEKKVKSVCSLPETVAHTVFEPPPRVAPEKGQIVFFRSTAGSSPFAVTLLMDAIAH